MGDTWEEIPHSEGGQASEETQSAVKEGSEWYSVIVAYEGLHPTQYIPQKTVMSKGKPVMQNYGGKPTPKLEPMQPSACEIFPVAKWTAKMEVMEKLNTTAKQINNSLKSWLTKAEVAMWYHNGNEDDCSLFGGPHLHIITSSGLAANGKRRRLGDIKSIQTLRTKVKSIKGVFKYEKVRLLPNLIHHFNQAPRKFMGTNCRELFLKRKETLVAGYTPEEGLKCEPESEEEEEDNVTDEDDGESAWSKHTTNHEGDLKREAEESWAEQYELPEKKKAKVKILPTLADDMIDILRHLMLFFNAYTLPDMWKRVYEVKDPDKMTRNHILAWKRLATKVSCKTWMKNGFDALSAEWIHKPFKDCIDWYCKNMTDDEKKYLNPEISYEIFKTWTEEQGINMCEFVTNIVDVMDRKLAKINTICLVGDSNSGKTVFLANPLKAILKFVGQVGNRGSNGDFVFMELPNKRLIIMEECVWGPDHTEDLKLLLGGEIFKVNVKFSGLTDVDRTPIIITSNKDPWVLDYSANVPFRNRMKYYKVREIPELVDMKLQLNPKVWWYLYQLLSYTQPPSVDELQPLDDFNEAQVLDTHAYLTSGISD